MKMSDGESPEFLVSAIADISLVNNRVLHLATDYKRCRVLSSTILHLQSGGIVDKDYLLGKISHRSPVYFYLCLIYLFCNFHFSVSYERQLFKWLAPI